MTYTTRRLQHLIMITTNNLVNSFIRNMTKGNRTESKYLRPLAKLDDTDKHYQITLAKLNECGRYKKGA